MCGLREGPRQTATEHRCDVIRAYIFSKYKGSYLLGNEIKEAWVIHKEQKGHLYMKVNTGIYVVD